MPKAGNLDYPSRGLEDCAIYLKRARETTKARKMTRDGFAQAIGQSSRGGGFGKLIGAMAAYGLVETGKGQITTTDLGEQVLYGDSDEQCKGKEKAVRKVRLFNEIYQRFGRSASEDQLRVFLRESAGVEVATVRGLAKEIGGLIRKNSALAVVGLGPKTRAEENVAATEAGELVGKLEMADYGILNIRDGISMDLAISLLTLVKKAKGWPSIDTRAEKQTSSASQKSGESGEQSGDPARKELAVGGRSPEKLSQEPRIGN